MKKRNKKIVRDIIDSYHESHFDPLGSYTGINSDNPLSAPTQDADDL